MKRRTDRRGGAPRHWRAGLVGLAVLAIAMVQGAAPGHAASGAWQGATLVPGVAVEARLIAAVDAAGSLATVPAGVQVRLPEGWKTYWRSPGDAGLPPVLDWAGSANLAQAVLRWPAPHRFTLFGIDTFGYEREVVFPLAVTPARPGEPLTLTGRLDLLVCSDICVPTRFDLGLALPAGPAVPDAAAANLIDRFAAQVPGDGRAAGLAITGTAAATDGGALQVTATAREPFAAPDLFVEAATPSWAFGPPGVILAEAGRLLTATLPVLQRPDGEAALAGLAATVTLVDGVRAMEQAVIIGPANALSAPAVQPAGSAAAAAGSGTGAGLLAMLGVALLGGMILNLMPCVLPVLSLKLLALAGQGGRAPAQVRLGFLASAAGILVSFLVLAAAAVALRSAGAAVGWGMQFQQPLFLVFMVVVLTLFACNLLGLFEIVLPWRLADAAGRAGGGPDGHGHGLAGHFATGAFATLLATPCSAPFLGTAVGFALSSGPAEVFAVFLALGAGLAAPYLLVALVPRLATALPRPGRWMVTLRRVLGVALVATAVWLLAVLAVQLSPAAASVVGGLMLAMALLLWSRRHLSSVPARRIGGAGAAVLALAAFAAPGQIGRPSAAPADPSDSAAPATAWGSFDPAAIDREVAQGRVVFVDVTAEWCLTCKANKLLVLEREPVAAALAGDGIVLMRGDWTRPDARIAAFLARYGRYGIPFNIVYGPGAPDGLPLPELLTPSVVIGALQEAAGSG